MNFMKMESTGTASWVLFAPVGQGSNLTGFHQETKKRRSFNCGSQDLIVQALATADNQRYDPHLFNRLQHILCCLGRGDNVGFYAT